MEKEIGTMIELTAKIDVNAESVMIYSAYMGQYGLSLSQVKNTLLDLWQKRVEPSNPFIWGVSKLDGSSAFKDDRELNYYIGQFSARTDFYFSSNYTLNINFGGTTISSLFISFDTLRNQFPLSFTVSAPTIEDFVVIPNSAEAHIIFPKSIASCTITFTNWNTPKYPLVITGIYTANTIDINSRNLLSAEFNIMSENDTSMVGFGIFCNSGSIKYKDATMRTKSLYDKHFLDDKYPIRLFVKNDIYGKSQEYRNFLTDKFSFDDNNTSVTVTFKDDLEEWQNINAPRLNVVNNGTAYNVVAHLMNITPNKWQFELDFNTEELLRNIILEKMYLKSGTLWSQWDKVCQAFGLKIYKQNQNAVVIKKAMTLASDVLKAIKIPSKSIYSTKTKFSQNRIKKVEVASNVFSKRSGNVLRDTLEYAIFAKGNYIEFALQQKYSTKEFVEVKATTNDGEYYKTVTSLYPRFPLIVDENKLFIPGNDTHSVVYSYDKTKYDHANDKEESSQHSMSGYILPSKTGISQTESKMTLNVLAVRSKTQTSLGEASSTYFRDKEFVTKLRISLEGEYYEATEETRQFGDIKSLDVYSVQSNELIQEESVLKDEYSTDKEKWNKVLYESIIQNFQNGIEYLTVKCSITEYYDKLATETDLPEISPYKANKPMTFEVGNIVIPMLYYKGADIPYGTDKDGNPKKFEVIGTRITFSGSLKQELTLKEIV
jgi:hypothetical protein